MLPKLEPVKPGNQLFFLASYYRSTTLQSRWWKSSMQYLPYPLLLVIAIIFDRVVVSSTEIGAMQSLRSLFVLLLLTSLAIVLIQSIIRDIQRTYFIIMMIWAILLLYRYLYRLVKINFLEQADYLGFLFIFLLCTVFYWLPIKDFGNPFIVPQGLHITLLWYFPYCCVSRLYGSQKTSITLS
jgi:hypothetical protein